MTLGAIAICDHTLGPDFDMAKAGLFDVWVIHEQLAVLWTHMISYEQIIEAFGEDVIHALDMAEQLREEQIRYCSTEDWSDWSGISESQRQRFLNWDQGVAQGGAEEQHEREAASCATDPATDPARTRPGWLKWWTAQAQARLVQQRLSFLYIWQHIADFVGLDGDPEDGVAISQAAYDAALAVLGHGQQPLVGLATRVPMRLAMRLSQAGRHDAAVEDKFMETIRAMRADLARQHPGDLAWYEV